MDLKLFLKKYNISDEVFIKTNLKWDHLLKIADDYQDFISELESPAKYLVDTLHKFKKVHSVRFRLKDKEHLIEKIIRKKIDKPDREINLDNYKNEITDLIGIRILHLFKEDWEFIHQSIIENWSLKEKPIAYFRKGDTDEYIDRFKKCDCNVEEHPHGYRSVHYLVQTTPNKKTYTAEIQVRTIFEEGWSEIDHQIRYPYDLNNVMLRQFLVLFNRFAGSADEMGSYVIYLKKELERIQEEHSVAIEKKVELINDLKDKLKKSELKPMEVKLFQNELDDLLKISTININPIDESKFQFTIPNLEDYKIDFLQPININFPDEKFSFTMKDNVGQVNPFIIPTIKSDNKEEIKIEKPKTPKQVNPKKTAKPKNDDKKK